MPDPQLIRCRNCGALNRVPLEKLQQGLEPVCGRCKTPLPLPSKPIIVTDATFSAEVERAPLPVLVDMWAPWCGPCRMIAQRFNVRNIPTLLVLKDGREVDRIVGVYPKPEIVRRLEKIIALTGAGKPGMPT